MSELDDLLLELQSVPPLQSFTYQELLEVKQAEAEWLVDRLIPRGSLILLAGRPKAGKSLLAIDLLASVALGSPFLGRPTAQGTALYVPAEDAPDLVARRFHRRLAGRKGVPLHVIPVDGTLDQQVRIDDPAELAGLAKALKRHAPDLLVLDPFREIHHQAENESIAMAGILRPLRIFARKSRCAIVIVHHRNKHALDPSQAARGSSAITGSVDVTITLDADANGDTIKTHVESRYGQRQHFAIKLGDRLRWEALELHEIEPETATDAILRCIEQLPGRATPAEIADKLGLSTKTVYNVLATLASEGRVGRIGRGTKADPYRYGPPE